MKAASGQHIDVIRYLVAERGADVNAMNNRGTTALMQAATKGQFALVQFLTEDCGANVNAIDEDGATILMKAAVEGHTDVVWYLARERKADVNVRDESGSSALLKAAMGGQIDVIRCLAREYGADVNETDARGRTLLMKAAAEKLLEVCQCLATECGANVDATDKSGSTALMQAAGKGDTALVQFLATKCGADVNAAGENGETAIIQAAGRGDIDVVQCLLVQCGAYLNAADKSGVTALMKATMQGHVGVVRFLGESGANINATNNNGYSALRIAGEQNDVEMQRVLTQFIMVDPSDYKEIRATSTVNSKVPTLSDPSWSIPPTEIELLNFVKVGNVGGEYRAKWLDTDVAVKLFIPGTSCHTVFEDEVRLWHQLRHPNVIKLYGACDASPLPLQLLVYEYTSNGSLHEYIKATPPKQQKVWSFLHQAALGLEYLHQRGIVHGDLRCSNILIGSDGLSKLVNFGRSDAKDAIDLNVSSIRWQAPEVLEGKTPSFTSDVYSLGMCILEAVTKEMPWKNWKVENIRDIKKQWDPDAMGTESWEPLRPHYTAACKLVWSMCCQNPGERASLPSVVFELERFVIKENVHPEEALGTIESYKYGETKELWMTLQIHAEKVDDYLYHQGFTELQKVYECLQESTHPSSVFQLFHTLLRDFRLTKVPSEQARVLQLSSTCATNSSFVAFFRRLRSLWSTLGESAEASREREACWEKQRKKRVEIFVSEVSKGYLIVEELKTQEERNEFLTSLKIQIEHPSAKYTPGQLDILKKAYEDIAVKFDSTVVCKLTPEWFIPWYELVIDSYDTLGSGGYGSVFRAKWLDSEVVVKRLGGFGVEGDRFSSLSSCVSLIPPATAVSTSKRSKLLATFLREVDIWFGFSHPHVVRLFGVGRPFFVCEYATNGTLVRYLRKHPNDLWQKLHETALGVQYLHARGVVHGDLKGNNIVIGSDNKAKVTDFGLSINADDTSDPQISGACHWVAPECFIREDSRPTYASDIYSLGMCIVEALRVVEAGDDRMKACLPWGSLGNTVVKYHVKQGELPSPSPQICQGKQWELVQRMCAFEPEKRLKISTVVDELEKLACTRTKSLANTGRPVDIKAIPAAITAMQALLQQLQDGTRKGNSAIPLYVAMWDQLEHVHNQIGCQITSEGRKMFCSLVDEAGKSTKKLEELTGSLVSFAETTLRCYALRRRLDKFFRGVFTDATLSESRRSRRPSCREASLQQPWK